MPRASMSTRSPQSASIGAASADAATSNRARDTVRIAGNLAPDTRRCRRLLVPEQDRECLERDRLDEVMIEPGVGDPCVVRAVAAHRDQAQCLRAEPLAQLARELV